MSWKDLRDLDCTAIQSGGYAWAGYVDRMVEQSERLRSDVISGHLSVDNFESDTATQVREHIDMFVGRFEDDLSDYAQTRVRTALLEAADALKTEQDDLSDLIELIETHDFEIEGDKHEYKVNPSGNLHRSIFLHLDPPQWLCDRIGMDKSSGWYDLLSQVEALGKLNELYDAAGDLARQYQDWLRAIMSRAHDADDDAAAALSAMRENPPELPPQLGATYDDLIGDYKTALSEEVAAEMEAIFNGESDMSPEQVNQWWEHLSDAEREALIAEHPEWVGPTDGIPTDVRDTANRTVLDDQITGLDQQIAAIEAQLAQRDADLLAGRSSDSTLSYAELQGQLEALQTDRNDLAALQAQITDDDGNPASFTLDENADPPVTQQYYLLGFGSEGSGQAIVSLGNPDTADNINAYVPGTGGSLEGASGGLMNRTETMAADAYRWGVPGEETATILWMGYDAPDNAYPGQEGIWTDIEAAHGSYAEDAAEDLESFTQGLRATTESPLEPANLTLTGHSYGTTVIGEAAASEGVDADNILFIASPGVTADTAEALGVGAENVYATRNDADVIQYTPFHGMDPVKDEFGATVIESYADDGSASHNHSTYWDEVNRQGRIDMSDVITGQAG
ncbi:alpha/beta hydrolase [Glycomyces sp. NPDC047010]|uniref:alpha/beta hydrolase n=1 Tax=Glycomyces sp. NPDC047010 TaxID=3155023 RepID=UPI0033DD8D7E